VKEGKKVNEKGCSGWEGVSDIGEVQMGNKGSREKGKGKERTGLIEGKYGKDIPGNWQVTQSDDPANQLYPAWRDLREGRWIIRNKMMRKYKWMRRRR